MCWRWRVHPDGVPLHIVQRGHNRAPRFLASGTASRLPAPGREINRGKGIER